LDGNTLELIFSCANRNLCDGKIEKDEKEGKPGKIKCFNCNKKLCRFSNLTNTAIIKEKVPTMNIKKDLKKPYPLKLKKSGRKLLAERYYQILRKNIIAFMRFLTVLNFR